jgi:hypothetical protein
MVFNDDLDDERVSLQSNTISKSVLCDADFPANYVNLRHPDDYRPETIPIQPEFVVNQRQGHARLILRISWSVSDAFAPMSFLIDTGAVHAIYLGKTGSQLLERHARLLIDKAGNDVVRLHRRNGTQCCIQYRRTPSCIGDVNIIGLRFLLRFGFSIEASNFCFKEDFDYF